MTSLPTHDITRLSMQSTYHAQSGVEVREVMFRANEAEAKGYESARDYLIPRTFSLSDRKKSEDMLSRLENECGPVVDSYPTWHPLVSNHDPRVPQNTPNKQSGYQGLDHTIFFAHGFVTCPYGDGQEVLDSVAELPTYDWASISAERLETQFYSPDATPILVRCDWKRPLGPGKMVPKSLAVPLMLEMEFPSWRWATRAERWETMRPSFLGAPYGSRSSLFVNQETALAMKRIYLAMVETGMFGPLKMG